MVKKVGPQSEHEPADEVLRRAKEDYSELIGRVVDKIVTRERLDINGIREQLIAEVGREGLRLGPGEPQDQCWRIVQRLRRRQAGEREVETSATNDEAAAFGHEGRLAPECAVAEYGGTATQLARPIAARAGDAVGTARRAVEAHVVGNLMGVWAAGDALERAWVSGEVSFCDPDVSNWLYCRQKQPRLSKQQRTQLPAQLLGLASPEVALPAGANRDFLPLFDALVMAAINVCDDDSWCQDLVARQRLVTAAVNLQDNLAAHVSEFSEMQAIDVSLDLQELVRGLGHEDVVAEIAGPCAQEEGPWPVVRRLVPQPSNRAALWALAEAADNLLGWTATVDPYRSQHYDADLVPVAAAAATFAVGLAGGAGTKAAPQHSSGASAQLRGASEVLAGPSAGGGSLARAS